MLPESGHEVEVEIDDIKLCKAMHERRLEQEAARTIRERVVITMPPRPTIEPDEPHYVLNPETNLLLFKGQSGGQNNGTRWTRTFTQATRFMNHKRANMAGHNYRHTRATSGGLELKLVTITAKEAMARFPATNIDDEHAQEPETLALGPEGIVELVSPDESVTTDPPTPVESPKPPIPPPVSALPKPEPAPMPIIPAPANDEPGALEIVAAKVAAATREERQAYAMYIDAKKIADQARNELRAIMDRPL